MARVVVPQATPTRRVTRSQSREWEDPGTNPGLGQGSEVNQNDGLGKIGGSRLSVVQEESPASSQTPISGPGSSVVPESPSNPEGQSYISGTTAVPQDSSFDAGELDPVLLLEELPDLHTATNRLLDLFVSKAGEPKDIIHEAKRIVNLQNTTSKRLKRAVGKFGDAMNVFTNKDYIDVAQIKELIPSVKPHGTSQVWSPSPILHRANCARLALDVLLATGGSQSPHRAVERLESQFPAPFMDKIDRPSHRSQIVAHMTEKRTFELALEFRTQSFIMELERHQTDKDSDPRAILKAVFYDKLAVEDDASAMDSASLKGFRLLPTFEDENGRLPKRYQDDVVDRIGELELELDQDGSVNVASLRRAFWSRFIQCTARFIYSLNTEILSDLQQQPKFDDVRDLVREKIERGEESAQQSSPPPRLQAEVNSSRLSLGVEAQNPPREPSVNETPSRPINPPTSEPLLQTSSQDLKPQGSTTNPTAQSPVHGANQRKPHKARRDKSYLLDALQRRQDRDRQQEYSHLESQRPNPPRPQETRVAGDKAPPSRSRRDEIPQSPSFVTDDTPTVIGGEDTLNSDGFGAEAETTTSPAMRRTHNGLFFGTPPSRQTQTSPSKSTTEIRNDILGPGPRRRNWTDPQPDASRVSPISESQSAGSFRTPSMPPPSSQKRPLPDSDGDSDDGFDQDNRALDLAARRAQKPAQVSAANKRMRTTHSEESDAAAQLQENLSASSQISPAHSASQPSQPARSPARSAPQPGRHVRFETSHQATTDEQASRWLRRNGSSVDLAYLRDHGIFKQTSKWAEPETERLVMLMTRHGSGWIEMVRQDRLCPEVLGGPLFTKRTNVNFEENPNVQLKDKARVLKAKIHRAGLPFPPGFEHVAFPNIYQPVDTE